MVIISVIRNMGFFGRNSGGKGSAVVRPKGSSDFVFFSKVM